MTDSEKLQKVVEEIKQKLACYEEMYFKEEDESYSRKYMGRLDAYEELIKFVEGLK